MMNAPYTRVCDNEILCFSSQYPHYCENVVNGHGRCAKMTRVTSALTKSFFLKDVLKQ